MKDYNYNHKHGERNVAHNDLEPASIPNRIASLLTRTDSGRLRAEPFEDKRLFMK